MIPKQDWLMVAQRLCVGQKVRIKHGFERTCAMDVYNNDDSWSCYCHRCKDGGKVYKEHQNVRTTVRVDEDRVQAVPADVIRLRDASPYVQQNIWKLLISKGIGPYVIPEDILWFSAQANRLLLIHQGRALGRALSEYQKPKWLMYGEWGHYPRVWLTKAPQESTLVITEDALSAHKIAYAMSTHPMGVLATLGTNLTQKTLLLMLSLGIDTVVCAYDGDTAGYNGGTAVRQRTRPFDITFKRAAIPAGYDPKDLDIAELQALIGSALNE